MPLEVKVKAVPGSTVLVREPLLRLGHAAAACVSGCRGCQAPAELLLHSVGQKLKAVPPATAQWSLGDVIIATR